MSRSFESPAGACRHSGDAPAHRRSALLRVGIAIAVVAAVLSGQVSVGATGTSAEPVGALAAPGFCHDNATYVVCLTDPRNGAADSTIIDRIEDEIEAAGAGDSIRVAMYLWRDNAGGGVADRLVAARSRGANVRVVLDDRFPSMVDRLRAGGIAVTVCELSCLPNASGVRAGVMHNKFFLFDKGSEKVVISTSTNLTVAQTQLAQNMLLIRDDAGLHDYLLGYWRRLEARSWTVDGRTWAQADKSGDGDRDYAKAYVFPRDVGDIVAGVLGNVEACREGDDRVWVAHSLFHQARGDVVDQLARLRAAGCDVKIVVARQQDRDWLVADGRLAASKIKVHSTHSKVIVIDARYAGQWRKLVFVGSHNLSVNSLRNANDLMLRLINSWVVDRYICHFRSMYADSTCDWLPPT